MIFLRLTIIFCYRSIMNDLKFFIHYCFSFFTDFHIVPLTKFMLRFRLHSLSVPDWFALSPSFILRFAFTKCSTQIIKSLLANSLRASSVAKQLISSPRAAHPRSSFCFIKQNEEPDKGTYPSTDSFVFSCIQ